MRRCEGNIPSSTSTSRVCSSRKAITTQRRDSALRNHCGRSFVLRAFFPKARWRARPRTSSSTHLLSVEDLQSLFSHDGRTTFSDTRTLLPQRCPQGAIAPAAPVLLEQLGRALSEGCVLVGAPQAGPPALMRILQDPQ